jgi:hypothetical protein
MNFRESTWEWSFFVDSMYRAPVQSDVLVDSDNLKKYGK